MLNYHELTVNGKVYKLRVRMRDHAELDKAFGGSFLGAISDEEKMGVNAWSMLGDLLNIALRWNEAENGKFTRAQVDDLLDNMIDDGCAMDDAVDCILKTAAVSGFFPRKVAEDIMQAKPGETPNPEA